MLINIFVVTNVVLRRITLFIKRKKYVLFNFRQKFEKPTPIQCQAIPCVMSGRDIMGIAKTGSGKTIAFLLPMFRHIMDQPELEEGDGPIGKLIHVNRSIQLTNCYYYILVIYSIFIYRYNIVILNDLSISIMIFCINTMEILNGVFFILAIILTPTRELAMQIQRDCKKFSKPLNLNVVCVYGGTGISEQIAELKRGAEIVVCTPGRMIDMMAANNGRWAP